MDRRTDGPTLSQRRVEASESTAAPISLQLKSMTRRGGVHSVTDKNRPGSKGRYLNLNGRQFLNKIVKRERGIDKPKPTVYGIGKESHNLYFDQDMTFI